MKKLTSVLLVLALVLSLFTAPAVAEGDVLKIGILASSVTHGWLAAVAYNAESRCKALQAEHANIQYKLATSGNADEMAAQLDDLMIWGAGAIVIFPQWGGMEAPVQRAVDAGVVVVAFDMQIDVDGVYLVSGDNLGMGTGGAEYIADKLGGKGNVVVLNVPSSGSVSADRERGFVEAIAAHPDIHIIGTYPTAFSQEAGRRDMADILAANPEIDAVFSMDDEATIGALQAIRDAGRTDIKVITGGGGSQMYFNMMLNDAYQDIWLESALYSPAMVKDAVDLAIQILTTEDDIPAVKIIPTTIVDRENVHPFIVDDEDYPY